MKAVSIGLFSVLITIGSIISTMFRSEHVETNCCCIMSKTVESQNLCLGIDLLNSGMNFTKHKIKKEENKVFIDIYGKYVSGLFAPPEFTGDPDFCIDYSIPQDVDEIYLRGKSKNDLKLIWKRG